MIDLPAHRLASPGFLVCLLMLAAGCTSAPIAPAPMAAIPVPTAWAQVAADRVADPAAAPSPLARWWLRLNDPLLAELVDEALRADTRMNTAQAALRQARALRDVTAGALWPTLGGSAAVQRSASAGLPPANDFRLGVDASWELDFFGERRQALSASDAGVQASAASLDAMQVSIAAEVGLAYIGLRSAQARLAIADDNLASQLQTLQITQWRLQAGLVSSLDAEQARGAAEQTRSLLPALQIRIAQGMHALAVLTGQPPAALMPRLQAGGPLPQAADDLVLAIPAETLRQRPDVRAAEWQVSAAIARVAQADAARAPNFALAGSLGLGAATLGALTQGSSVVKSLLASVSMPLFDAGSLRAQVRAQQAALEQAEQAWRATVLGALQEVEDALAAQRGDRERLVRLRLAAQAATQAAVLARQRYGSGLVDFQTVLETQRTQLGTQDSVASAAADLSADQVRLYKALGGGWDSGQPVAAITAPATTASPASGPSRTSTP